MHFQDRKLPCRHACQVCQEHNHDLESYVSPVYTIETYRSLYSDRYAMPQIRLQDLPSDAHCLAPKIQKRKGRPRKKRLRRETFKRRKRPKHCQMCRSTEHDRRQCDYSGPPMNVVLQQNRCKQQTNESDTSSSQFSDWRGFSDDDLNRFSDEKNTLDPNPAFLVGPLMAHWQNSSHDNCELLA